MLNEPFKLIECNKESIVEYLDTYMNKLVALKKQYEREDDIECADCMIEALQDVRLHISGEHLFIRKERKERG